MSCVLDVYYINILKEHLYWITKFWDFPSVKRSVRMNRNIWKLMGIYGINKNKLCMVSHMVQCVACDRIPNLKKWQLKCCYFVLSRESQRQGAIIRDGKQRNQDKGKSLFFSFFEAEIQYISFWTEKNEVIYHCHLLWHSSTVANSVSAFLAAVSLWRELCCHVQPLIYNLRCLVTEESSSGDTDVFTTTNCRPASACGDAVAQ